MALTAQPSAPSSWAGWPQQHGNREYGLTESAMMPYEPRHVNPGPLPRPPLSPHYYSGNSFSAAPMTTMVAPHYQHQPVHYGGYASFPPSPAMEFKQDSLAYEERPQLALHSVEIPLPSPHSVNDCSSSMQRSRSPSANSESHMSSVSTAPTRKSLPTSSRTSPRVITTNIPVSEEIKVDFNTGVDTLMKAIQAQVDPDTVVKSVESDFSTVSDLEIKTEQVRQISSPQLHDMKAHKTRTLMSRPRPITALPHCRVLVKSSRCASGTCAPSWGAPRPFPKRPISRPIDVLTLERSHM